jgi:hypothetical protein
MKKEKGKPNGFATRIYNFKKKLTWNKINGFEVC